MCRSRRSATWLSAWYYKVKYKLKEEFAQKVRKTHVRDTREMDNNQKDASYKPRNSYFFPSNCIGMGLGYSVITQDKVGRAGCGWRAATTRRRSRRERSVFDIGDRADKPIDACCKLGDRSWSLIRARLGDPIAGATVMRRDERVNERGWNRNETVIVIITTVIASCCSLHSTVPPSRDDASTSSRERRRALLFITRSFGWNDTPQQSKWKTNTRRERSYVFLSLAAWKYPADDSDSQTGSGGDGSRTSSTYLVSNSRAGSFSVSKSIALKWSGDTVVCNARMHARIRYIPRTCERE